MLRRTWIVGLCMLTALLGLCGCKDNEPDWQEEQADQTAGYRRTVLYYQNDDGYMVPVMKYLPWEEGIGQAALRQLVDNSENRRFTEVLGLHNTVPEGVQFELSISDDALATLNVCELERFETAEREQAFVCAVVNTLTEFPTIDQVQLRFDGKTKSKLPNGTSVAEPLGTMPLNTEPLPVNASEDMQYALTLYYPNRQASLNIPVTRCVAREPDFDLAMRELLNGPQDAALLNCFPEGTKVLSTSLENDIATVNLSREFEQLANNPDLEQAAIQTMQLTARHFGAVAQLQVQVEGEAYQGAEAQTMAMPLYVNEYR